MALQTYKKVNGHVNVPQSFVVPDNDKWPEEIRGEKKRCSTMIGLSERLQNGGSSRVGSDGLVCCVVCGGQACVWASV